MIMNVITVITVITGNQCTVVIMEMSMRISLQITRIILVHHSISLLNMNSNLVDIGSFLVGIIPDLIHQCHIAIAIDPGHQSKLHHISIQGPGPGLNLPQYIEHSTVHHTSMRINKVDTGLVQNLL